MAYLELSFDLGTLDPEAAEAACFASGALAVTLSDARDDPVLEPRPDEVRLWPKTRLQSLYAAQRADAGLIVTLAAALGLEPAQLQARAVADRVWEREWLRDFHARRFGRRLWVCPRHESVAQRDAVVVALDPGLAFGTGTHASTALCLDWLDGARLEGCTLLDYGCGSGVLAIAAAKLQARAVYAFDVDPQALIATRDNAADNAVADRVRICECVEDLPATCDVLLANILANVLIPLAEDFAMRVRCGGQALLGGILREQESQLAAAYRTWFDMRRFAQRDGWVALAGIRR